MRASSGRAGHCQDSAAHSKAEQRRSRASGEKTRANKPVPTGTSPNSSMGRWSPQTPSRWAQQASDSHSSSTEEPRPCWRALQCHLFLQLPQAATAEVLPASNGKAAGEPT
jgi:hypothetical protein